MFSCSYCDAQSLKWQGRCSECGKWGTLSESGEKSSPSKSKKTTNHKAAQTLDLSDANIQKIEYQPTHISELDRVLAGGLVPGSVTLLSGEPGIGKSTLVAQISSAFSKSGKAYYASGEESEGQVLLRFKRLGLKTDNISFSNNTEVESIISAAQKLKPSLLIIDSIQTMMSYEADSIAGTPTAVRASTSQFIQFAKSTNTPVLIIGQVTKEGNVAGPKTLEHLVDTLLTIEGDKHSNYRMLRAKKHRFGSTDEVGIFEMTEKGMEAVQNPSARFLEERSDTPGSAITCILEGTRPILIEVQALAEKSLYPNPVRRTSGFDSGRLQMLLAILSKKAKIQVGNQDIYINIVGGMKVKEHAVDLAVCAAIISSVKEKTIPKNVIHLGELGLGGEIRSIPQIERRIKEAKRLGFTEVISPKNVKNIKDLTN